LQIGCVHGPSSGSRPRRTGVRMKLTLNKLLSDDVLRKSGYLRTTARSRQPPSTDTPHAHGVGRAP
jgi:hypothetical protein